jgi:hypothetical protein
MGSGGASGGRGGAGGSAGGAGGATNQDGGTNRDGSMDTPSGGDASAAAMSFFVTSRGGPNGGDFRVNAADMDGLAGADAFCKQLATAVSATAGAKPWRAYLSTSTVDARSRIGVGPWRNARGVVIAQTVAQLHEVGGMMNNITMGTMVNAIDENGAAVTNDVHDILTGSTDMGMRDPMNRHCINWTSSTMMSQAWIGHSNRMGGGSTSWNAVHAVGCAMSAMNRVAGTVTSGGGRGSIYCFSETP